MPIADLVYNQDLAFMNNLKRGESEMANNCNCGLTTSTTTSIPPKVEIGYPWIPVPPIPVPPPMPVPPYPPYPYPTPVDPDVEPKKGSVEAEICKLSKRASTISKMMENLAEKKKDVIIKVGEASYNFGNIDLEITGWEDGSYAATVETILEFELNAIKAKIAELAAEIGDDSANISDGPIAGNG